MTPQEREQLRTGVLVFGYQCLTELATVLHETPPALNGLIELAERLDGSTVPRIAFAGRFSAGKTTLVNAILGEKVLPEGMAETTAIPTRVRYGNTVRLFLKSSYGEYYEASDAERREFMNLTASNLTSELLKRYVQQQDEAVLEHPNVSKEVEVIDLPGVSSSYQNIEERALMSLRFANGVVWVANAKQGGLTRADIEYLKTNVPAETPKLIALTHLDLVPPSQQPSVLSNARSLAQTIPNVVGVVGTTKGQSLAKPPMWGRFLSRSKKKKRLKPLVQEVVEILEKQQARLKEETEKEVEELLSAAGLSEAQFTRYLMELFEICKKGIFEINEVVEHGAYWYGAGIDRDAAWKKFQQVLQPLYEKRSQTWHSLLRRSIRGLQSTSGDYAHVVDLILFWYETGFRALTNYLRGIYQSAATLCWRFEVSAGDSDAARAFRERWQWDEIGQWLVDPLIEVYRDSVRSVKRALLADHKIRVLYNDGQRLLESGQLDELG
jgi:GTPase SAR1 family protein